eukprot:gene4935-6151_t
MKILSILFIFFVVSTYAARQCSVTIEGENFNLNPLVKQIGDDDYSIKSATGDVYIFNICNDTVSKNPCGNDHVVYKVAADTKKCTGLGSGPEFWSLHDYDQGQDHSVIVEYKGGDQIPGNQRQRFHTSFVFHCKPESGTGTPKVVDIGQYGHVVIHWTSQYGCPTTTPSINLQF